MSSEPFQLPTSAAARSSKRLRPRSLTGLLITGFGLVALPLVVAVIASVIYVDRLTEQSERLVKQGVEVTRHSKRLDTLLIAMERSARQYRVLGQPVQVDRFREQAGQFSHELQLLGSLQLDIDPNWHLRGLVAQTAQLAARLGQGAPQTDAVIQALGRMSDQTARIGRQGNLFVDHELKRLQQTAAHARIFLLLCIFALIPCVLVLVVLFINTVSRPLREIRDAIGRLGDADFEHRIEISAPAAELDELGHRLDWMRRRLATLDNEKQQFIRTMSHELKTPLASIREGAELLRDGTVGALTPAQSEVAEILQRNSIELASMLDNLLGFAAWQQHRATLAFERFDVTALIEQIVTRQRLTIEGKQLSIERPTRAFEITADRDRMHLIIDNLLANAVKFSPVGARIVIDLARAEGETELRIGDEGPGVARTDRERIFDSFVQGSNQPVGDSPVRGTGIGLSLVRECVLAHGGRVSVRESSRGGAEFVVQLPVPHAD